MSRTLSRLRLRSGVLLSTVLIAAFIGISLRFVGTASAVDFTNNGTITIPTSGNASPYPSTISVSGLNGLITDVNVKLDNLSHTFPDDLDILVVSPGGDSVILMSDAGGGDDIANFDYTFDDEASSLMSDNSLNNGFVYKPTNFAGGTDAWGAPAPQIAHGSLLSDFDGESPNGVWSLYVVDDASPDSGAINAGWQLQITVGTSIITIPNSGNAAPYPSTFIVSDRTGPITDVNVVITGLSHTFPADLDILLESPDGDTVILMSDACNGRDFNNAAVTFNDEASSPFPDDASCSNGGVSKPVNYGSGDTWGAPAPQIAHGTLLSDFDGENPNGTWKLYIVDDASPDGGFVATNWSLGITTGSSAITINDNATASPYPYNISVAGQTGVVVDVNVTINGLNHDFPDDLDVLLVSPTGVAVMLMSDGCTSQRLINRTIQFNDETNNTWPDEDPCDGGTYRPANNDSLESLPSPAPAAPYHTRLSVFDGINPNGTWQVYIDDDTNNGTGGYIATSITLTFDTEPSLTNIVSNGTFGSGETSWQEFGDGSGSVSSGIYQFQRTGGNAFTIFQNTTADWNIDTPFELRFDAGNTGSIQKRLTVLVWDQNFGRQRACSFWLEPNQPMTTYQMLGDSANAWTNATVHFYASTQSTDGFYRLDNVTLRRRDDLPSDGTVTVLDTLCVDPTAPYADTTGQPDSANLLNNPGFSSLPGGTANETWGAFSNIALNLFGGYLRIQQTGVPVGSVVQDTNDPVTANRGIEFTVDLGNSSANWQRVTILLHNETFDGLQFCTFWLAPSAPLATYTMRTHTDKDWNSQGISASIYPSTNFQWILVDNTSLRTRGIKVIGTGCYEPGSTQPALDDLEFAQMQAEAQSLLPALMPTATPQFYAAPNALQEMPLIVTAQPPAEGAAAEGSVSE